MKRSLALIVAVLALTIGLTACGAKEEKKPEDSTKPSTENTTQASTEMKEFTVEELAKYNGQNGEKAYVAVDGSVYDVTDIPAWKDGKHNGVEAGKDVTAEIQKAPHGVSKLEKLTKVGTLKK